MTERGEVALAALTLLLGVGAPPGCASEKTTTTEADDSCSGVLSCTADLVGFRP